MKTCTTIFGPNRVVVGDPVDVVTGANLDRQTDFVLAGPLPLPWYRWYDSSQNDTPGELGWGHRHDYERRLVFDLDGCRYVGPSGTVVAFTPLERDGGCAASEGYRLLRVSEKTYAIQHGDEPEAVFEIPDGRAFARLARLNRGPARIEFRYSKENRLNTILDSKGRSIRVEHDGYGRLARLTLTGGNGPSKRLAEYQYDSAGNLVKLTDPYNHSARLRWDPDNRVTWRTDRRGYGFRFEYDGQGRCVRAGGEDGFDEVRLEYRPPDRVTRVTHHDGGVWLYRYDESGVVTEEVAPDGGVRTTAVQGNGRAEVGPDGSISRDVVDESGHTLGAIDPFGYFHPAGGAEYDPHAYALAATPAERVFGDLIVWAAVRPPTAGSLEHLSAGGAAAHVQTGKPDTPAVEVNEFGVRVRATYPDGSACRWLYDPNGNVLKYTDRGGGVTSYEYASCNARVAETGPLGGRVRYEYSPSGMATAVTDAGGTRSEYRYDLLDRLVEVRRHGVTREVYDLDAAGNMVCKRDGSGRELVRHELGSRGQPVVSTFGTGEVHAFGYDARGRIIKATAGAGTVTFRYTREFLAADLRDGKGVEHKFGVDGVEVSTLFGTLPTRYQWLSATEYTVTDPTGLVHHIRHLNGGLLERSLANGCQEIDQYDAAGRCLARITTASLSGGNRASSYRYSPEGCLTRVDDTVRGVRRYEYDAGHRLMAMTTADGRRLPLDLDVAGNILRMPGLDGVALLDGNRLHRANGEQFEHDSRNHLTSRGGVASTTRYHYDANDLLVRVETPGMPEWTAVYDPFCRRVWKAWGKRRVEYWWDGDRLAAERDETGRLRVYVYVDHYALVPLLFVDYAHGEAGPTSGAVYTVHTDQIGTPIEVRDSAGELVWEAEIAPYGVAVVRGGGVELNLRFPGHYFDAETGLHYNRFRYYDPTLGRYIQSDPIGIGGGLNLYAYPARPLDRVDLRGLSGDTLTPAQRKAYDGVRGKTPSETRRDDCNTPGSTCAATGEAADPDKRFAADHVVPLKKVAAMPGFTDLSPAQQAAVANNPNNFQPMKGGENSSKGAKEVKDWTHCRGEELDPQKRAAMLAKAQAAEKELQAHIDKMLKDGKEAKPRACSGCPIPE